MDDYRMSWSRDKVCDRGTELGSDITARCRVAGGGLVGWFVELFSKISRGLLLNVGT
jgi:hypothetical protein